MSEKEWKPDAGVAVFALVLFYFGIMWEAWVMSKLWTWYVVPLGVEMVSWRYWFGINILIGMLTAQYRPRPSTENEYYERLAFAYTLGVYALLFGWIGQAFLL